MNICFSQAPFVEESVFSPTYAFGILFENQMAADLWVKCWASSLGVNHVLFLYFFVLLSRQLG
jgi:hypothetical protein